MEVIIWLQYEIKPLGDGMSHKNYEITGITKKHWTINISFHFT